MRTARNLKQRMKYSLKDTERPKYELDEYGNIKYYEDEDGNRIPLETGETEVVFGEPVEFESSINNKLNEVLLKSFGIDDSTNYAQITEQKGVLPLKEGSVIWKQSEVKYKNGSNDVVDEKSADYIVKGVADEGINIDLFLLQKNVK